MFEPDFECAPSETQEVPSVPRILLRAGKNCSTSAKSKAPSLGSHWYKLNVGIVELELELALERLCLEASLKRSCMNGAIPVPVAI